MFIIFPQDLIINTSIFKCNDVIITQSMLSKLAKMDGKNKVLNTDFPCHFKSIVMVWVPLWRRSKILVIITKDNMNEVLSDKKPQLLKPIKTFGRRKNSKELNDTQQIQGRSCNPNSHLPNIIYKVTCLCFMIISLILFIRIW